MILQTVLQLYAAMTVINDDHVNAVISQSIFLQYEGCWHVYFSVPAWFYSRALGHNNNMGKKLGDYWSLHVQYQQSGVSMVSGLKLTDHQHHCNKPDFNQQP